MPELGMLSSTLNVGVCSNTVLMGCDKVVLRRVLMIVSPVTRNGRRAGYIAARALELHNVDCVLAETKFPQHATQLASQLTAASEFDAVIAVGGDGTVMEVVTGLAGLSVAPPVGIIPAGTANILARTLGIPLRSARAARTLLSSDVVTVDLGRTHDGRRFALGLGIGLDAAMIGGASSRMKKRFGYAAYVWSAVRAGLSMPAFRARLTVDGTTHELETSSVLIANFGVVVGGLVRFGNGIENNDGVLNACVYSPRSRFDAVRVLWRLVHGDVERDRCFFTVPGRAFRLEFESTTLAQADGELLGSSPIDVTVDPGAAHFLVPARQTSRTTELLMRIAGCKR